MTALDRRSLLKGVAAAALVPAMPVLSAAAMTKPAIDKAVAWVVGTPGEFDWQHIVAETAEEAWRIWRNDQGYPDEEPEVMPDPSYVRRIEAWDGRAQVSGADWLRANMGYTCDRCGDETDSSDGWIVEGNVVCDECVTMPDRIAVDRENAIERLTDDILNDGEEEVRERLHRYKQWPLPDGAWDEAVALAAASEAEADDATLKALRAQEEAN